MIFAIPIIWDFLDQIDKSILAYFVCACKILTSRKLQKNELDEAFTKLVEMNKLVEEKYGQEKISGESFCNAFIIKVQRTMGYVQSLLD